MDWDKYRDEAGHIDLVRVFQSIINGYPTATNEDVRKGYEYIRTVVSLQPIRSRQVAATVIAYSLSLSQVK